MFLIEKTLKLTFTSYVSSYLRLCISFTSKYERINMYPFVLGNILYHYYLKLPNRKILKDAKF